MNSRGWAVNWSGTLPAIERDMRTFATAILLDALDNLADCHTLNPDWHTDRIECVADLADAVSQGFTGSLLAAYVVAAGTGVQVEYVFPCETQLLTTVPVQALTARNANPAK